MRVSWSATDAGGSGVGGRGSRAGTHRRSHRRGRCETASYYTKFFGDTHKLNVCSKPQTNHFDHFFCIISGSAGLSWGGRLGGGVGCQNTLRLTLQLATILQRTRAKTF